MYGSKFYSISINRDDICSLTSLLLFKYANYRTKRPFISTANEALFGNLMTIGDVNDIFLIEVQSKWAYATSVD